MYQNIHFFISKNIKQTNKQKTNKQTNKKQETKKTKETKEEKRISPEKQLKKIAAALVTRISGSKSNFFFWPKVSHEFD